ncbi:DegT/DnrJ/EryC1/StrS family aminotransferase [Citrobacter portucalensis]|uniref:DegT/DnrJ/EryC1/StrS family aminotransferase n=2 Tax=Citrobacter portucalensis TaxID=1639133 RepID=UPI0022439F4F|nr:DegT/DnrJ/EryC1/StrS aminotransferase family protein [Citrobacter portucalensis]MCW8354254.1 DegT/DnrJ/EryC1/StrS aminotransferase family protein [Citrobacter portucalensis]MCX8995205.1 DegT/DnrJ/EryC1/StrS aminotransferase family protein [Citrobacter portucalensis]MCX9035738.1 DegT/DnrJ/EryC1/StrS aminotransferase family protein [Citrobacter portucalensis]MCX9044820.1 DegT/DnrJ/EryC1/StrS aminotransferase family protein [Citrobacter portucalensis]MCX9053989.1 DegT/DnrJ/EryC1/StrS aminotran
MLNTSFSPWPSFTQEEADAVSSVLLSNKVNYWTGNECRLFETEFAEWVGTKYAVALSNGTLALDVALKALNIAHGDDVIVTSRTFLASASCIVTAGANPIFADVDLNSQCITAETISAVLTPNTKAVIIVHLAGMPAEMDPIMDLAAKHGLYVIEDCAQAHGASYKGKRVGSIGHIAAWSFCQDKIMTTGGEGGMVTTNDKTLWSKMWSYKDHGKSYDAVYNREHKPGFRWLHESFGTNWRMLEMQAVIGRIQLRRMADWTKRRQENGKAIDAALADLSGVRLVNIPDYIEHAEYKHYVFIKPSALKEGWTRDRIINEINNAGVPCYQGSCSEIYLEKAFDNTPWRPETPLPNAFELGETSLMFLVHPTLTCSEIELTCEVAYKVLKNALN